MLQLSGNLMMSNDYNVVIQALLNNSVRVVSLDEGGDKPLPDHPNIIKGTCLLPPPTALMAEIDGNADLFMQTYQQHLMSDIVNDYLSTILAAMYRGMEVILYIPEYNSDSVWLQFFTNFLLNTFGIVPGILTPAGMSQPCLYNNALQTDDLNAARLFLIGAIDVNEFLVLLEMDLHQFAQFAPSIMFRVLRELNFPANRINELEMLRQSLRKNPKAFSPIDFM